MIWVFFLLVAVGLVAVFAALVTGRLRYDPMSDAVTSQHDPGLPEAPHARDVDGVRFDRALRGYRMDQVDEVLDALRDTLARQESTITALRRGDEDPYAVAAQRDSVTEGALEPTEHPEALHTASPATGDQPAGEPDDEWPVSTPPDPAR